MAGRYHSLVIEKESFPSEELEITAWTEDGLIMAARHKKYKHLQVTLISLMTALLPHLNICICADVHVYMVHVCMLYENRSSN